MNSNSRHSRRFLILASLLCLYLFVLFLFVFYPRPILESNSTISISEYLQTHANIFYKILYANNRDVAIANFFMLTPFAIIFHLVFPKLKLRLVFLIGCLISILIETTQLTIPGRVSDLRDLLSNFASVGIGLILIRFLPRKAN
ncbi:MAG: VanZ family protein [Acidobacteria bacterium]|nr:VanZ family protein [Acidobacteriota bacterium]